MRDDRLEGLQKPIRSSPTYDMDNRADYDSKLCRKMIGIQYNWLQTGLLD